MSIHVFVVALRGVRDGDAGDGAGIRARYVAELEENVLRATAIYTCT